MSKFLASYFLGLTPDRNAEVLRKNDKALCELMVLAGAEYKSFILDRSQALTKLFREKYQSTVFAYPGDAHIYEVIKKYLAEGLSGKVAVDNAFQELTAEIQLLDLNRRYGK